MRCESRLELLELLLQLSDLPAFSDELGGEAVEGEAESLGAKFGLGSRLVGMMVVRAMAYLGVRSCTEPVSAISMASIGGSLSVTRGRGWA